MIDRNKIPVHILNSLGFNNLEKALKNVFDFNIKDADMIYVRAQGNQNEKELYKDDFRLYLKLYNTKVEIVIEDTREFGGMWRGAGGNLYLSIEDISEKHSPWNKGNDGNYYNFLIYLVSPEEVDFLKHEGALGKNEPAIENSLLILKKYLEKGKQ
ncbi:hypothetical protein [Lactococcus allomyrinae]|uniref:Uncharacterized protein n=1 Tax=Lactococcus allomyrinae TaxID=2419773 RepID=A0A387BBY8_9LACT|nr:hypothetical protein [Lactococcus allomyrinae]AYF99853.1 hypothetical protein D7I46_01395 [Lactococcus allomyrinae]